MYNVLLFPTDVNVLHGQQCQGNGKINFWIFWHSKNDFRLFVGARMQKLPRNCTVCSGINFQFHVKSKYSLLFETHSMHRFLGWGHCMTSISKWLQM